MRCFKLSSVGFPLLGDSCTDRFFCFLTLRWKGKYIYIETSSPRQPNDNAKISKQVSFGVNSCVVFYYHMYGQNVEALRVKVGGSQVFELKGSQQNKWLKAEVRLPGSGSAQVGKLWSKNTISKYIQRVWMKIGANTTLGTTTAADPNHDFLGNLIENSNVTGNLKWFHGILLELFAVIKLTIQQPTRHKYCAPVAGVARLKPPCRFWFCSVVVDVRGSAWIELAGRYRYWWRVHRRLRRFVFNVTSVGKRSSPCPRGELKPWSKFNLTANSHFMCAQLMPRQVHWTHVSLGIGVTVSIGFCCRSLDVQ